MIDNLKVWQLLSTNRWNDQHWRHLHWLPGNWSSWVGQSTTEMAWTFTWSVLATCLCSSVLPTYFSWIFPQASAEHYPSLWQVRWLIQSLTDAIFYLEFWKMTKNLMSNCPHWGTDPRTQRRRCATQWWPRSSPLCETSGTSPLSSVPGVSAMWRLLGEGWGICGGPARTSPTPGTACSGTLMSTMRWDISKLPAKFLIWPRSIPGAIQTGGSSRTRKWMELPWWALRWQSHHYNDD